MMAQVPWQAGDTGIFSGLVFDKVYKSCTRLRLRHFRGGDLTMTQDADRILRIRSLLDRTGLSRATHYRKMQQGKFPRQIAISTRYPGYTHSTATAMRKPLRNFSAR